MNTVPLTVTECENSDVHSKSSTPYTDVVSSKKQTKNDHVKRPLNKFMLFSKLERQKIRDENPRLNQKAISLMLGQRWKSLSLDEQHEYEKKANRLKHLHKNQFPGYTYRPRKRRTLAEKRRYRQVKIQPAIHQSTVETHMSGVNREEPLTEKQRYRQVKIQPAIHQSTVGTHMSGVNREEPPTEKQRYRQIQTAINQSTSTVEVSSKKQPKKDHVKRPLNRFMLFSKLERPKIRAEYPDMNQSEISSRLGKNWKALSHDEQQEYEKKADLLKHRHKHEFPGYRYRPKRRRTVPEKPRCSPESVQQIQPAIDQSTGTEPLIGKQRYRLIKPAIHQPTTKTDEVSSKKQPKEDHVKRLSNTFVLFSKGQRSMIREENPHIDQTEINSRLGQNWKALSHDVLHEDEKKTNDFKYLHETEFPGYKFCPKGRHTSTEKPMYLLNGALQIEPVIHQSTSKHDAKLTTSPEINKYAHRSMPDRSNELTGTQPVMLDGYSIQPPSSIGDSNYVGTHMSGVNREEPLTENERYRQIQPALNQSTVTDEISKKKPKDHVKRPLNKFMLYSKLERPKIRAKNPGMNQSYISALLGKKWKALSPAEQQEYEEKAINLKHLHETEFPDYKFCPKKRGTSTKKPPPSRDDHNYVGTHMSGANREENQVRGPQSDTEMRRYRRIQPVSQDQSTRTPHMMLTMSPEPNNYPLESTPDRTDEPPMFNIENLRSEVSTDSSEPSTSHLAGM